MPAEGAFGPGAAAARDAVVRAARREAPDWSSLVAARLVRELIAADARADRECDEPDARFSRLLGVVLATLGLPAGALLHCTPAGGSPCCFAVSRLGSSAIDVLEGRGGEASLAERACTERCAFLLTATSGDPLMAALREELTAAAGAAVVPLRECGAPMAALVLVAEEPGRLDAQVLRLLAPSFHLLGVLVAPGRGQRVTTWEARAAHARGGFGEAPLGEGVAPVAGSALGAAEGALALPPEGPALERELAGREARIAELEREVRALAQRLAANGARPVPVRATAVALRAAGATEIGGEDAAADAVRAYGPIELDEPIEADGVSLGEVAGGGVINGEIAMVSDHSLEEAGPAAASVGRVVFDLGSDPEVRAAIAATALRHGAPVWAGEGSLPAGRLLLAANILEPGLGSATGLAEDLESIAYAYDRASGSGFEIGPVGWIRRAVDAAAAAAAVRRKITTKVGCAVVVSSQLRELGGLRDELSRVGVSSSVACDARQALELLEIVRRPDALLVDLGLPDGQGLVLAAQLRDDVGRQSVPLFLLLPEQLDPDPLLRAARRAGLLGEYGPARIARLVGATLSRS